MDLEPVERLDKDLRDAAELLTDFEARILVDAFYMMQENRKRADNQLRAHKETGEPSRVLDWYAVQSHRLENQVGAALTRYSGAKPLGQWTRSIVGMGPILTAGLLAHIDFEIAKTVGDIWRFAGLDPTTIWEKGKKRPWNASLRTLCWKIGESFVYVSNKHDDFYGKFYKSRKQFEIDRNLTGYNAPAAEAILKKKNIKKDTIAYQAYSRGILPDAHIHARAKRYAVKLFLAHFHEVGYWIEHKEPPPNPYVLDHMGHTDRINPPNWVRPR